VWPPRIFSFCGDPSVYQNIGFQIIPRIAVDLFPPFGIDPDAPAGQGIRTTWTSVLPACRMRFKTAKAYRHATIG